MKAARSPGAGGIRDVGLRLSKESAHVLGQNVILKPVTVVASILLARFLGPVALGLWALVTSTSGWIWVLAEVGLGTAVVPVVAEARVSGRSHAEGTALRLGLFSALPIAVAYALLASFFASDIYGIPDSRILFMLSAITFLPYAITNVLSAILQAHRRIPRLAQMGLATGVLNAAGLVSGAAFGGLTGAFFASLATNAVSAIGYLVLFRVEFRRAPRFLTGFDLGTARRLLELGGLTMASTFVSLLGSWVALTMLAEAVPVELVGFYSVAFRLSAFVALPASAVFVAFFPLASESYSSNPDLFDRVFREVMRYSLVITLPLSTVLTLLAPEVVTILYGPAYAPAGTLLAVVSASGLLQAFSGWGSTLFYVTRSMRRGLALVAVAMTAQVVSAAVLISRWGAMGLVSSTLVLNFVIVGMTPLVLRGRAARRDLFHYSLEATLLALGLVILGSLSDEFIFSVRLGVLLVLLAIFTVVLHKVFLTPADRRFIAALMRMIVRRG